MKTKKSVKQLIKIDIRKKVKVDLMELREIDKNNTVAFQFRKKYEGNHTL